MTGNMEENADIERGQKRLEEALDDLIKLVNREVAVFQELLDALTAQYQSVLQEDVEKVRENSSKVQELVEETRILEQDRLKKTAEVSDQLGMPNCEPTLSHIIPLVENQYGARLRDLRSMLLALSSRIQSTNLRNKRLLNRALRLVNRNIRLLTGAREDNAFYNEKGQEEFPSRELFNAKT